MVMYVVPEVRLEPQDFSSGSMLPLKENTDYAYIMFQAPRAKHFKWVISFNHYNNSVN